MKRRLVPKAKFDIKKAIENGMTKEEVVEIIKPWLSYQMPNNFDSPIEPSLTKLKAKGRINQEEYNALCTGDRNDILLAFNLEMFSDNDDHVRSILIKKAIEDGE